MTDVRVLRVTQGFNGWTPKLSVVSDGTRRVLKLSGWTGGQGNPPQYDLYLGAIGYVTDIEDAANINGDVDLSGYLTSATASSTYQTQTGMSSYLTSATASSTYQTQTGMSSYLTTTNAATTYTSIANSRYQFVTDAGTTYIVLASAVTANGNTIIELSNNSLTSITVNTSTATGKTAGDSVTIQITGTYAAQLLVASGVTLNGTLAFSANAKIKTLIYRGSDVWTVLGG